MLLLCEQRHYFLFVPFLYFFSFLFIRLACDATASDMTTKKFTLLLLKEIKENVKCDEKQKLKFRLIDRK